MKHCFRLRKTAFEPHEMLKPDSGENAMGTKQTCEYFSSFGTSVEDNLHVCTVHQQYLTLFISNYDAHN
jgi:hypothetical protein